MYAKTTIIGHVGRDPEMRYLQDGTPVTAFSVATSTVKDKTVWYRVSAWRKQAESCNTYVKKGMLVAVEGSLQEPKAYQNKKGEWTASLELVAVNVKFLSRVVEQEELGEMPF